MHKEIIIYSKNVLLLAKIIKTLPDLELQEKLEYGYYFKLKNIKHSRKTLEPLIS